MRQITVQILQNYHVTHNVIVTIQRKLQILMSQILKQNLVDLFLQLISYN